MIDSGATHHLCSSRQQFLTLRELAKPIEIRLGDNSTIPATARGTVELRLPFQTLVLEALYAPRLHISLLSVRQLSERFQIIFKDSACFIDNHILVILSQGVYRLSTQPRAATLPVIAHSALLPTLDLWHQRLGHLNYQSIKSLVPSTAYTDSDSAGVRTREDCEICIKAKHQRKIERKPATRTIRPFELVHSDLCGPITPDYRSGVSLSRI